MPEYNLGRAHGEVVIDTDTKGIKQGDQSLAKFEKTVESLQATINKFDRVLDRLESNLNDVASAAHKADDALDDLDGAYVGVHKSTTKATRSQGDFNAELQDTIALARRMHSVLSPVWKAYDHISESMKAFNNANTFKQYLTATNRATLFTTALNRANQAVYGRVIGLNRVYGEFSDRQNNILRTAGKISAIAGGFVFLNKFGPKLASFAGNLGLVQSAGSGVAKVLQRAIDTATTGEGRFVKLSTAVAKMAIKSDDAGSAFVRLYRSSNTLWDSIDKIGQGVVKTMVGFGIFKSAVSSLGQRFAFLRKPMVAFGAGLTVLGQGLGVFGATAQVTSKGLVALSNGFNYLLNASKQLAGGLLAVPGIFATIIGAAVPIISTFKGLAKTFEDVFKAKDAKELAEALAALPAELRPLGQRLADVKKSLKEIQAAGVLSFLGDNPIKEIDAIESALKGPLIKGFMIINNAARQFRQELIGVVTDGKNITNLNTIWQSSARLIDNVRNALAPLAQGMSSLAAVGSQFFADWTSGADTLTQKFAAWIEVTRQTGQLRKYMDDALSGAKDLVRGVVDLTKGLWGLLTLFATNNGDNALDKFAKSMEKFNNAVQQSKAEGTLKKIADAVKNIGTDKIEQVKEVFNQLKGPISELAKTLGPLFKGFSEAFSDKIVSSIKIAATILNGFFSAFNGLQDVIGYILGFVVASKLIKTVVAPMLLAGKAVVGLVTAFKGLQTVFYSNAFISVIGFLDRLIPGTNRASAAFDAASTAATRFKAALIKIGAIAGTIAGAFAIYKWADSAKTYINDFNKSLEESKKQLEDYKDSLRNAFSADSGKIGKNVFDTVTGQMTQMRADLQKEADKVPDIWDNVKDFFNAGILNRSKKDAGGSGVLDFGQSKDFNNIQKARQDAEHAKKQFDELGLSSQNLAAIVTGTDSSFKGFVETLRSMNKNDAANSLEQQRSVFQAIQQDFATASPGAVDLANAIQQIGDAGSDTAGKLQGLNAALKALGFNKADQYEAAFAFSEAIRKLGDEAANAVDKSAPLEGIFGPDGALATSGPAATNAENLYRVLKGGVNTFKETAASGGDVDAAWKTLQDNLPKTAAAFNTSIDNIQGVITNLTGNDYIVKLLLSATGEDKVKANIAAILAQYAKGGDGAEIKIPIVADADPGAIQKSLDDAFGPGKAAVGNGFITIAGANITPEAIKNMQDDIPGLAMPGSPPPKPAEMQVAPVPAAPAPGTPPAAPKLDPAIAKGPGDASYAAPVAPAVDTKELDAAKAKIDELQNKIAELNANPPKVEVKPEQFEALKQGTETAIQAFENLKVQIQAKLGEAQNIISAWGSGIQSTFAGVAASAQSYGVMIGNSFAAGLSSMSGVVALAAQRLAQSVNDNLKPGSPTKKGPLSGKGWVGYSGTKTGQAYGDALAGTAGYVGQSAGTVAGSVADGLGGLSGGGQGPYELGKLLGLFNDIFGIGSKIVDAFSQVADTIFQTMKLVSDPLDKGTFFGQSPAAAFGWKRDKNVSDADLAQKRADKIQSELGSESKKQTDQEKAAADQQKKDAEKQAQVTGDLIDAVSKGERVAPVTDEEKKTQSDAKKDATKQAKADAKAAGTTYTAPKNEPLTDEQANLNARRVASALGDKLDALSPEDRALVENGTVSVKTQDQMLAELVKQTPLLQGAIDISKKDNATQDESLSALQTVTSLIDSQGEATTPAAKQQKQALESLQGTIAGNAGLAVGENPIDQAAGIAGNAANVAKDVFASIQSVMDSIGAANELGDMFVRGLSNTEDVMKAIDQVQVFLQTAGQIASAVSSGLGVAAGIAGAAGSDPSGGGAAAAGALSGASQIASLVSAAFSTINGVIDLGQEVYRIAGKYVGQFAGFLVGGGNGPLMGDVKFLLDTVDGSLKTWSQDNPEDKRVFDNPFQRGGIREQQPKIGQISVFGGPAQDPREMTNEMMFAVSAASSGVWSNDY